MKTEKGVIIKLVQPINLHNYTNKGDHFLF